MPDKVKSIPTQKARQGRRGFPVLMVLVFGLLLGALAWWGVEVYGIMLDEQQTIETPAAEEAASD